jgi:hypothetical protein
MPSAAPEDPSPDAPGELAQTFSALTSEGAPSLSLLLRQGGDFDFPKARR